MRRECTADESLQTVQEAFQLLRPLAMQPGSSAVQVREVFDVARTLLRSSRVASPTHVDAFAVVRTCAARIEQMLAAGEPQVVDNPFQLYLEQSSTYLWRIDEALGRYGGPSQLRQAAELVRELNSLERRVRWAEMAGKSAIATVTLLQFPVCAAADARLLPLLDLRVVFGEGSKDLLTLFDVYRYELTHTMTSGRGDHDTYVGADLGGDLLLCFGDVRAALQSWSITRDSLAPLDPTLLAGNTAVGAFGALTRALPLQLLSGQRERAEALLVALRLLPGRAGGWSAVAELEGALWAGLQKTVWEAAPSGAVCLTRDSFAFVCRAARHLATGGRPSSCLPEAAAAAELPLAWVPARATLEAWAAERAYAGSRTSPALLAAQVLEHAGSAAAAERAAALALAAAPENPVQSAGARLVRARCLHKLGRTTAALAEPAAVEALARVAPGTTNPLPFLAACAAREAEAIGGSGARERFVALAAGMHAAHPSELVPLCGAECLARAHNELVAEVLRARRAACDASA